MAKMNSSVRDNYSITEDDCDQPKQIIETLRDKLLKELHVKQMRKNISFEEQKKLERKFVQVASEENFTNKISGLLSLSDFVSLSERNDFKHILKSSGLNAQEVEDLLPASDQDKSNESDFANMQKLKSILERLNKRLDSLKNSTEENETFNGAVSLSKNDYEEECILVTATAAADKLTNCLIKLKPQTQHINNELSVCLQQLERDLMETVNKTRSVDELSKNQPKKRQRINHKDKRKIDYADSDSLWDCMEFPQQKYVKKTVTNVFKATVHKEPNVIKINVKNKDCGNNTDISKPFVLVLESSQLISLKMIEENRMQTEDLLKIEKFKNYSPGIPSNKLYVKNLPDKITAQEIASIFGNFESDSEPKINYRILKGKMKGQAFVTFKDIALATLALETCNGYILKEKPMIIAYGRN